jgi:hypothetical protein
MVPNACGGNTALASQPGAPCGNCGTYACNGTDAVTCSGDHALNACNGCSTLTAQPGGSCGTGATGSYVCSGTDAVVCSVGELVITSGLNVSSKSVAAGDTLQASVTYTNVGEQPVVATVIAITMRAPGAGYQAGDDFAPTLSNQTIAPQQSLTLDAASRPLTGADPAGTWSAFSTWEDASSGWHDGPNVPFTVTASKKMTLVYMAGFSDYSTAITSYKSHGGITAVGPQVYVLTSSGALQQSDSNFSPTTDTNTAHNAGIKMYPLIACGNAMGNGCTDSDLDLVLNTTSVRTALADALVNACNSYGYDGWQLDWETYLTDTTAMTAALSYLAQQLRAIGKELSVTSFPYNYPTPYDPTGLAEAGVVMNIQAYDNTYSNFVTYTDRLWSPIGATYPALVQVGLGDYSGSSPPIAGNALQFYLQNGIQTMALWPEWGTEVSSGGYGYSDTIYGTTSFYGWMEYFLSH